MEIGFFGSMMGLGPTCGYSYAAIELIEAWQRLRIPVWWGKDSAPVAFCMGQPGYYDGSPDQLRIGYTAWESTRVPDDWPKVMNTMDEIWTPSNAVVQWFKNAGIEKPLKVLPHGINTNHFPLKRRFLKKDEPFTFLHIGEPTPRKGGQMVYEIFKELYGDNSKFRLILKGDTQIEPKGANVVVIRKLLSQDELRDLYLSCHAMIYPSYGEGFGLIPFSAIATGMPTALTNWGGILDFIKYGWPIKVNKMIECDYWPHEGLWAEPNYESAKYWMQSFGDSPDYFFNHALARGINLRNKFSWDNIAKISQKWMIDSLESRGVLVR